MTTQTVGKCCRDPNYVDPWPASILGQYNPDLVNFNNGGYSPNPEASNINKHTNVAIDNFYQPTRTDQQSGSSFDSKVVSNSDVKVSGIIISLIHTSFAPRTNLQFSESTKPTDDSLK